MHGSPALALECETIGDGKELASKSPHSGTAAELANMRCIFEPRANDARHVTVGVRGSFRWRVARESREGGGGERGKRGAGGEQAKVA